MSPGHATQPASRLQNTFRRGEHWIWMTGAALAVCLLMIVGLLGVVMFNGLGFFWPHPLVQADFHDGTKLLGVVTRQEAFHKPNPARPEQSTLDYRTQFKVGNRDLYGADFRWIEDNLVRTLSRPADAVGLEREEYGDFYGYFKAIKDQGQTVAEGEAAWALLLDKHREARAWVERRRAVQKHQIGQVNRLIQDAELDLKQAESRISAGPERDRRMAEARRTLSEQNQVFEQLKSQAAELDAKARRYVLVMESVDAKPKEIQLADVVRPFLPNQMALSSQLGHYASKVWEFISGEPRESNTEGGILPAIFGTVFMTLLMSVAVVPFGVLAAFYLREYARQGPFVRMVRIAVNNLAGVPSIVFGVFGLGFFVYFIGGTIDELFYPETLPAPTYGTGGVLWASLTLALLTVPVVIVATEESIAAVPRGSKEGSLALGASHFQTICRVVLPASVPGILTGLILAIARGAGEVAPLMITGVVKLAPNLPLDGTFPFVHLDRKFMHLGFHIYDVGFQSPNIEAAKPMVFTTALLLLLVVALLNITAVFIRDRIRKKYKTGAFA